ncbi:hypothetical protein MPDQ_003954 [Monascus purpureus]|uniref:Xylanolytic transcriptional activator regulatory domain-containing protein n=1 Tax=Monascus purpureus TaxID=5098 RepID=A0A507QYD1_MONPU|nr:hypothetical protein MPDQ_003954 [Monascus purpureus]
MFIIPLEQRGEDATTRICFAEEIPQASAAELSPMSPAQAQMQHPAPDAQKRPETALTPRTAVVSIVPSQPTPGPVSQQSTEQPPAPLLPTPGSTPNLRSSQQAGSSSIAGNTRQSGLGSACMYSPTPIVLSQAALSNLGVPSGLYRPHNPFDMENFWRSQLTALLPTHNQCDMLISFYLEHINWIYQAVHVPSFRKQYFHFWDGHMDDVDLIWLSLLFTMLSVTALVITDEFSEAVGFDAKSVRDLAHTWHFASRQALYSGGFESRPRLMQLTTFLVTQTYWLAIKSAEAMQSCLGQAVRNAQALHLDQGSRGANCLDTEMRRRIWWDLWCCDTFQSLLFGRTPLIQTGEDRVPFPSNCNDHDITESAVDVQPSDEPTELSANIARAEAFKILRRLFKDDGAHLSSWEHVSLVDEQIQAVIDTFPCYRSLSSFTELDPIPPHLQALQSQYHSIHSSLCTQRIRMMRPFLGSSLNKAYDVCLQATQDIMSVYKYLRSHESFRRNPKFYIQAYETYTSTVQLAAFLLVEPSFPPDTIRGDIEMVIADLEAGPHSIPIIRDGKKTLERMLQIYDRRGQASADCDSIAREIAPVFGGGEHSARRYLSRCDIAYLLDLNSADSPLSLDLGDMDNIWDFDLASAMPWIRDVLI